MMFNAIDIDQQGMAMTTAERDQIDAMGRAALITVKMERPRKWGGIRDFPWSAHYLSKRTSGCHECQSGNNHDPVIISIYYKASPKLKIVNVTRFNVVVNMNLQEAHQLESWQ